MLRFIRSRAGLPRAASRRRLAAGLAVAVTLLAPSFVPGEKRLRDGPLWVAAGPAAKVAVAEPAPAGLGPELLLARATLHPEAGWPREPIGAGFVPAPAANLAAAAAPPEAGRVASNAVPLPAARPAALTAPTVTASTDAPGRRSRRARAAPVAPMAETRSFFAELFGLDPEPATPALAYAALDGAPLQTAPRQRISPSPAPEMQAGVAIYDIRAQTLTLPNGEKLEAHSGLGDKRDDPDFAHIRMKGVTPPGTYDLTEREALFHGVRAIRMNPVGGSGAIHGRAGILAHTYMLGPRGDSNGCMSVRDYDRFLQAYLRGEIRRVVVVAGEGPSGAIGRLFGGARRG